MIFGCLSFNIGGFERILFDLKESEQFLTGLNPFNFH